MTSSNLQQSVQIEHPHQHKMKQLQQKGWLTKKIQKKTQYAAAYSVWVLIHIPIYRSSV